MATTTNYNWSTPDDTSLVKDGAAAIRTLGSSIDTTTKALNPSTTLGDIEYRSSTANTNTRLGIGTTGQILTVSGGVPAWTTQASSSGLTLITTTSFSAQTSQSFNNVFSSTYDNYKIIMTTYGSADQNMTWKFRASGTDNTSANYYYAIWGASAASGAVSADNNAAAATSMIFAGNNNSAQRQLISMDVISPMSTTSTKGILYNFVRSRTGIFGGNGWGLLDVAGTAFDGFTITPNSGNTTGTVSIYGWSK